MIKLSNFLREKYLVITPILLIISIAQLEQYSQLTTSGTFGAALRLSIPILLAGLGGPVSYTHLTLPTMELV